MNKIIKKERIAPQVTKFVVNAPDIANKRQAGQFVILRLSEEGERIPLTIADANPEQGTITIVSQEVGKTTAILSQLQEGEQILDLVGPLGKPTHIEKFGTVVCIGGGIGIAPMHPIAQAMKEAGNQVISILGARNQDLLIMEDEMRAASNQLEICTDDGSYGTKGLVTDVLNQLVAQGVKIDLVVAIGPTIMMKFVCKLAQEKGLKVLVSLNTIMVDGTGMCGGCRVTVGGKSKFVCVDGPEFDGSQVDFDEMMRRMEFYQESEKKSYQEYKNHKCKLEDKL